MASSVLPRTSSDCQSVKQGHLPPLDIIYHAADPIPGLFINRHILPRGLRGGQSVVIYGGEAIPLMTTINPIEADFLTHCIEVWCNETPQIAGRPLMFTTGPDGDYERVLLTHDQIESLYMRIQSLKSK